MERPVVTFSLDSMEIVEGGVFRVSSKAIVVISRLISVFSFLPDFSLACRKSPISGNQASDTLFVFAVFLHAAFALNTVTQRLVIFQRVAEIGRQVNLIRIMLVIQRAEERHMWFEKIDVQHERLIAISAQKIAGL